MVRSVQNEPFYSTLGESYPTWVMRRNLRSTLGHEHMSEMQQSIIWWYSCIQYTQRSMPVPYWQLARVSVYDLLPQGVQHSAQFQLSESKYRHANDVGVQAWRHAVALKKYHRWC